MQGQTNRSLILATHNPGKIREYYDALTPLGYRLKTAEEVGVCLPEETGQTFLENARIKARAVAQQTGLLALGDDSGLAVDALDGAPGVFSARYAGPTATAEENNEKLIAALQGVPWEQRTATFICTLSLWDSQGEVTWVEGRCRGYVLKRPRGKNGFAYDPYFWVPQLQKSYAELNTEEKNRISHRGLALRHLYQRLAEMEGRYSL
ncbi:MAG: RdgB/HAM1 family non-canonical purine NTP pyrophosphatase [Firmicutes bacterium]|nr:RdgB/HAM1 family non-canonical purine NTP pyrophosphatase [Bacillota bacterium]